MSEKTVLITGGMGGLGTELCRLLHKEGYRVATTYIHDSGREKRWKDELAEDGYKGIEVFLCDVSDWDACVKLGDEVRDKLGHIENLVNMAGITSDATLVKMQPEQWSKVLSTNLTSVFNVTKQFIGPMVEKGYGRVVNISSVNAAKGQFGQTNYAAAKAGMHGFTKSLAQEVVRKGVTVNTVSPGYIATDMVLKIREDVRSKIEAGIPAQRFGTPAEIARAVAFLLDENAGYITGTELEVNGGLHMR